MAPAVEDAEKTDAVIPLPKLLLEAARVELAAPFVDTIVSFVPVKLYTIVAALLEAAVRQSARMGRNKFFDFMIF